MAKELCLVHANCQGPPLVQRLMACPDFARAFECRLFTNYVGEPVPAAALARCGLFLHQHLGPAWGELASERLAARLPASATRLCVPNMCFTGYWPLWSGRPGFDYRCEDLETFLDLGRPAEETLVLFLRSDPAQRHDLEGLLARTLDRERHREGHTPVKYVDLIAAGHATRRLFNTVNHPGPGLMDHAARGVLRALGLTAPDRAFEALGDPFPEFEQPIHPGVARFFGWPFAGPETRYNVYGRPMTYARYAANYVAARRAGVTDFIAYLQGADHAA